MLSEDVLDLVEPPRVAPEPGVDLRRREVLEERLVHEAKRLASQKGQYVVSLAEVLDELLCPRLGLFRFQRVLARAEVGGEGDEITLADGVATPALQLRHHPERELAQEALLLAEIEADRATSGELLVCFPLFRHQLHGPLVEPVALLRQLGAAVEQCDQREQERIATEIANRAVLLQGPPRTTSTSGRRG
jgi:hypothetical protein